MYNFCVNYLKEQTIENFPNFNLDELEWYYDSDLYSWPPYFDVNRGEERINDLMKMFAMILQNRYNLSNIINFIKNYDEIKELTNGFDVDYLSSISLDHLHSLFEAKFGKLNSTWKNYCHGLLDAAKYLKSNFTNYADYVCEIRANTREAIKKLMEITGIGPALARNYLKEIGLKEFGKPDLHLMPIYKSILPDVIDENSFDIALRRHAAEAGVDPYKLDRIMWVICSGNYFKHGLKIRSGKGKLRNDFIAALTIGVKNRIVNV